jgi:hypothetical protein
MAGDVKASPESIEFRRDSEHFCKLYRNLFCALGDTVTKIQKKSNEIAYLHGLASNQLKQISSSIFKTVDLSDGARHFERLSQFVESLGEAQFKQNLCLKRYIKDQSRYRMIEANAFMQM